ncbi:SDR family oxidoreductase [Streptomyces sp. AK010]|uniref:SDR family oxidoreductase n=1 Tax=Streptomyces sp. AK010 TaxID=2723074 RepID=UPI001614B863|nr:SDR family oxidoreductase [Streptomyces sp. AK010]MBB6421500.1 nucleoside-diphosphate-sugar epimerase [Streptomyces sp. AK010]
MTTLLTGATGFLGSRLLLGLLTRNQHVTVLGRGSSSSLRTRVRAALEAVAGRAVEPDDAARLRCVGGDITQPWLGLPPALYGRLAREAEAVWHCAGDIALTGERGRLLHANVQGTAHVLEFAEATAASCRLIHMSTIAVAGRRDVGHVGEDDLTDAYGFETHYDESKYRAEVLVRDWARRLGRSAVVLRPSVVASDAALPTGAPGHPLEVFGKLLDAVAAGGGPGMPTTAARHRDGMRLRLYLPVDASINIVQDDYATEAMLRIGQDAPPPAQGVRTCHVVHPSDTPVRLLTEAVESRYPGLTITCVNDLPDPTAAERYVATGLTGFLSYSRHTRTYGRGGTLALTGGLPDPPAVDRRYLVRALGGCDAVRDRRLPDPAPVT